MDERPSLARRAAGPLALFLFGLLVSLYYGRRGYMPLDQSIVFDGGWRILCGQVPFRDYHAPNGFVPHALQALFFAAFGVTWLTYCLHAAVVNGLFALLVHRILTGLGLARGTAYVYAALSALVLYPPFGVPYMDQHAFFFSLLAVAVALCGRKGEEQRPRVWPWLALPAVLALAGLSKQIPSAFALPIVAVIALWDTPARSLRRLKLVALGTVAVCAVLAIGIAVLDVDLVRLDTYFRRLPSEVGAERYAFVPGIGAILERMRFTGERLGLRSTWWVHGTVGAALLSLLLLAKARRAEWVFYPLRTALLAEALLAMCLLFVALTSNQPEIGVPYLFLAAGLVHVTFERGYDSFVRARRLWLSGAARALGAVVLVLAVLDGWRYTTTVNATRKVNDIEWNPESAAISAPHVHPALSFLRWQLPPIVPYGPAQFTDLANFLAAKDRNYLVLSDASILYGLTGHPSVAPSLWWHPGLTIPTADDPELAAYERLLLERIESLDVRFVVLDGDHTWIHVSLDTFPQLKALVEERRKGSARFGTFEVIDLGG